jgi:hypothetical protein
MAGNISDYLENALLDHSLGTSAFAHAAQIYCALYTVAPSDAGGGTEVTGNGYARQAINFGAAAGGAASNSGQIEFTASGGNWGTIVAIGLFDAVTDGNLHWHGTLTANKTINDGDTFRIAVGNLDVSLD